MKNSNPLIYLIDDEEHIVDSLKAGLEKEGYTVHGYTDALAALKDAKHDFPAVVITDILMPDLSGMELIQKIKHASPESSFIIMTAHGSFDSAIQALRLGVIDYLTKPFRMKELIDTTQKALSQTRFISTSGDKQGIQSRYQLKNLISHDPRMLETFTMLGKIAQTDATVLITGESGTGKEMVARFIHYNSKRKNNSFVSVNCAALPHNLLESELFGYEKGAFTGASAIKQGLFEIANGGTFFLDEVGEIPIDLQAKLLRVLQERVVNHLGGIKEIPVDIRLIAATSLDLPKAMKEGRFREDLFYRLNVVPVTMPPLRDRKSDIPLFIDHFLDYYQKRHEVSKKFHMEDSTIDYLKSYQWPGNIRELENLMERIVTLGEEELITKKSVEQLLGAVKAGHPHQSTDKGSGGSTKLNDAVDGFEKQMILEALKHAEGNKFRAARKLGITRQNLRYKLKKYGIEDLGDER